MGITVSRAFLPASQPGIATNPWVPAGINVRRRAPVGNSLAFASERGTGFLTDSDAAQTSAIIALAQLKDKQQLCFGGWVKLMHSKIPVVAEANSESFVDLMALPYDNAGANTGPRIQLGLVAASSQTLLVLIVQGRFGASTFVAPFFVSNLNYTDWHQQWRHVAFAINFVTQRAKLWVDGYLITTELDWSASAASYGTQYHPPNFAAGENLIVGGATFINPSATRKLSTHLVTGCFAADSYPTDEQMRRLVYDGALVPNTRLYFPMNESSGSQTVCPISGAVLNLYARSGGSGARPPTGTLWSADVPV